MMVLPTMMEVSAAAGTRALRQWNILRQVDLSGRIDPERLRGALASVAETYGFSHARRAVDSDGTWHWLIQPSDSVAQVHVLPTGVPETEGVLRELQAERLSPSDVPAFRCIVVRAPDADRLIFNFCHERTDGIGAMAFLASLQRAYVGEPDPARGEDWVNRRYAHGIDGHGIFIPGLLQAEPIRHLVTDTAVASDSSDTHIVNVALPANEVRDPCRSRGVRTTVTHRVVAAVSMACDRWNRERGLHAGRICIAVPVNGRPGPWARQGFFSRYGTMFVNTSPAERATLESATLSVLAQASHMIPQAKQLAERLAHPVFPTKLPEGPPTPLNESAIATAGVSSLGAWKLGSFGTAGRVLAVWAPPLAQRPLAVAVGAIGLNDRVLLSFRFSAAMIGRDGAYWFAQFVRSQLVS